jgi:hypothetical protein
MRNTYLICMLKIFDQILPGQDTYSSIKQQNDNDDIDAGDSQGSQSNTILVGHRIER